MCHQNVQQHEHFMTKHARFCSRGVHSCRWFTPCRCKRRVEHLFEVIFLSVPVT